MSWTLDWHAAAWRAFYTLPMGAAERLDRAVIDYAATGRGPVQQLTPPDPRRLLLLVPGAGALLYLDPKARMVIVMRVFRRRW